MFDYYLMYFDERCPAIYRTCRVTKKITYQEFKYLEVVGWESSCCSLAQVESTVDGFERLL